VTDLHVDGVPPVASTPLGFPFPFTIPTHNSCYTDETAATRATRCLRFTSVVDNAGLGVLRLKIPWVGSNGSAFIPGGCHATQVIAWTNGKTGAHDAGPCEFHLEHGHFHYNDFVSFGLYRVNPDGSRGRLVGHSLKESFCLADDDYFGFGSRGPNGARGYAGQPGCSFPSGVDQSGASIDMGVSPGWGDVYTWDTPGQYIDVTHVGPGVYDIVAKTNPHGDLRVEGPASQCSSTRLKLTASSVKSLDTRANVPCP
jgi:hypothetical protein